MQLHTHKEKTGKFSEQVSHKTHYQMFAGKQKSNLSLFPTDAEQIPYILKRKTQHLVIAGWIPVMYPVHPHPSPAIVRSGYRGKQSG